MHLRQLRRSSGHPVARTGSPPTRRARCAAGASPQAAGWPPQHACIAPASPNPLRARRRAAAAAAHPPAQQAQRERLQDARAAAQDEQQSPPAEDDSSAAAAAALQLPPVTIRGEGGVEWRVRPYDPEADFWGVADLQSRCFHDKIPFAPLDGLAYSVFRAEVVDGLKSKARCLDPATYTILVAEAADSSSSSSSNGAVGAGERQQQQQGEEAADQQQGRKQPGPAWRPPQQPQRGSSSIVGIVELGLQEEGENVRQLRQAGVFDQMFDQAAAGGESSSGTRPETTTTSNSSGRSESAVEQPACVYLSSMGVSPEARRGGAARAMLLAAQWQAALWGQRHIALHVYADNTPAVKLYSSAGWAPVGRDPEWKRWLGGRVRSFLVKALPPAGAVETDAATHPAVRVALTAARDAEAAGSSGDGGAVAAAAAAAAAGAACGAAGQQTAAPAA